MVQQGHRGVITGGRAVLIGDPAGVGSPVACFDRINRQEVRANQLGRVVPVGDSEPVALALVEDKATIINETHLALIIPKPLAPTGVVLREVFRKA